MKQNLTEKNCELTAREEGWLPVGECRIEDLDDQEHDVVYSVVFHREPEFYNLEQCEFASASTWKELAEQQQLRIFSDAYRIPAAMPDEVKRLARAFRAFVADHHGYDHMTDGGCSAFRTPEHQGRHENIEVPDIAVFALIYDGGPIAQIMNLSYEDYKGYDKAMEFLDVRGYWCEHYTHWWSWIYRKEQ
jgi:hypothetical protein